MAAVLIPFLHPLLSFFAENLCPLILIVSIVIEYFIVIAPFEDEEVEVALSDLINA
jgi:hypothetical protein